MPAVWVTYILVRTYLGSLEVAGLLAVDGAPASDKLRNAPAGEEDVGRRARGGGSVAPPKKKEKNIAMMTIIVPVGSRREGRGKKGGRCFTVVHVDHQQTN